MEIHSFISPCKNIIFKIKPLKETNICHNSITNLKFQHKAKIYSSFTNPCIKLDLLLLLPSKGQNPLSYYTL
jgi:hypothetical protein